MSVCIVILLVGDEGLGRSRYMEGIGGEYCIDW